MVSLLNDMFGLDVIPTQVYVLCPGSLPRVHLSYVLSHSFKSQHRLLPACLGRFVTVPSDILGYFLPLVPGEQFLNNS